LDIKGILIDFGYTLAYPVEDDDRKYREGIAAILKGHGYTKSSDDLSPIMNNEYSKSSQGEVKGISEFWRLLLFDLGIPENPGIIQELLELRERHLGTIFNLYDDVIPVLKALKREYKLALVSNCSVGLSEFLMRLGLPQFFECVILSYEVGVRKPDKRMYLEALKRLRLEPNECVFVSDEICDLEGAKEIGLRTILVLQGERRTHNARDPNFKPDYKCDRISEIEQLLMQSKC
jgi:HAD superfamily hydrolase (TIGR01509 family)